MKDQIAELQKALSDSHLTIYDERAHCLQLARDYQLMVDQEKSDKKKLAEIQALNAEVARMKAEEEAADFKNFKDVRPKALAKEALKNKSQVKLNPQPAQQHVLTNQMIQ